MTTNEKQNVGVPTKKGKKYYYGIAGDTKPVNKPK